MSFIAIQVCSLKIDAINADEAISHVKQLLETERNLSPALKSALEVMLLLVSVLLNRATLNRGVATA